MEYALIQIRSGVKRGSEEGTEMEMKRIYSESIEVHRIPPAALLLFSLGFLLMICSFYIAYEITRLIPHIEQWVALLIVFIPAAIMTVKGGSLYKRSKTKVISKEKEEQITIFFPKISITNVSEIKLLSVNLGKIDCPYELVSGYKYGEPIDFPPESEWQNVNMINDKDRSIWVVGKGDDGWTYNVEIRSDDLYNRVKNAWEEYNRQLELLERERLLKKVEYLKKVGRYEEAARIYEELGMLDEAAEMRHKKREMFMLDLNELIRQLGERGFTITYHCAYCGAPVRISGETKAETIQCCSHCGSRIETIDIANFIKKYLS